MCASQPNILLTKKFCWRGKSFGDAQKIGEELARLEIDPEKGHNTKKILQAAVRSRGALHDLVCHEDARTAIRERRLSIIRQMMGSLAVAKVTDERIVVKEPVYQHVTDRILGPRYVRSEVVASRLDLTELAILDCLRALTGVRERFACLKTFHDVFAAIDLHNQRQRRRRRGA